MGRIYSAMAPSSVFKAVNTESETDAAPRSILDKGVRFSVLFPRILRVLATWEEKMYKWLVF